MSYRRQGAGRWNRATDAAIDAGMRALREYEGRLSRWDATFCTQCANASVDTYPREYLCTHRPGCVVQYIGGNARRSWAAPSA